jgi:hypothetical protein
MLWKKWFNNRAMDRYESRLGEDRVRKGIERYSLRKLKPINVDTRMSRDNLQWHPEYGW